MKNRGFISKIIIAIVAIVLLKVWFGFDFFKWLNTPEVKDFFMRIWSVILLIWEKYIQDIFQSAVKFLRELIERYT